MTRKGLVRRKTEPTNQPTNQRYATPKVHYIYVFIYIYIHIYTYVCIRTEKREPY